jgi:hypothetical protein
VKFKRVSETDVLIAVALWLNERAWTIRSVSPAKNQEKGSVAQVGRYMEAELKRHGIEIKPQGADPKLRSNGPDIVAEKGSVRWAIQCKGSTFGTRDWVFADGLFHTLKDWHEHYRMTKQSGLFGYALPRYEYEPQLRLDPITFIRKRFDIWVFLYDPEHPPVSAIEPHEDIPTSFDMSHERAHEVAQEPIAHLRGRGTKPWARGFAERIRKPGSAGSRIRDHIQGQREITWGALKAWCVEQGIAVSPDSGNIRPYISILRDAGKVKTEGHGDCQSIVWLGAGRETER